MSKYYCTVCGRQACSDRRSDDVVCCGPYIYMGPGNKVCCSDCSRELDEYGLFKEERSFLSDKEYREMYGSIKDVE